MTLSSSPRIALVLEDDIATRSLLMRALRRLSLSPIGFGSGEAALAWLELNARDSMRGPPAVMSVDVGLPHMTGFHFCECVRHSDNRAIAEVPIVVVTARNEMADEASALELGASYLAKPFHMTDYLDMIASLITSPAAPIMSAPTVA